MAIYVFFAGVLGVIWFERTRNPLGKNILKGPLHTVLDRGHLEGPRRYPQFFFSFFLKVFVDGM